MSKCYIEAQIIKAIKGHEAGVRVDDLCRRLGISIDTIYFLRTKFVGTEVNETRMHLTSTTADGCINTQKQD